MDAIRGAIENTVSISLFNKGLAGRIFEDVKRYGAKVVMKNNSAECVLMSPEEYVRLMDEVNDARLLAEASARTSHFDPANCFPTIKSTRLWDFLPRTTLTHPRWSLNELGGQIPARSFGWRGIATRYAKNASSFSAAVQIRCIAIWLLVYDDTV